MIEPAAPASCARCGTTADDVPLTWMTELHDTRGTIHYCDRCAGESALGRGEVAPGMVVSTGSCTD